MKPALFLLILSTLLTLVGLFITFWVHSRHHFNIVITPPSQFPIPSTLYPLVSIIVPARNEARNIRRCVNALLVQTYPSYEIIVIDDRSTDATPQILADLLPVAADRQVPLHIVQGADLRPGWAGKPHALVQGVAAGQGEWLCFVDADTFAKPDLLAAAYAAAWQHQADLFTIMTAQELGSFWEKAVLPLVFTGLSFGFPVARVNDPECPDAIASGQFMFVKRSTYIAVGGHHAVKDRIDEEKALAEVVKGAGYRLILADGRTLANTRMYTSLPEMWEGWTKNIFLGLRDRLGLLLFGATLSLIGALALPLWLLTSLVWLLAGGDLPAAIVAGEAALLWIYLLWMRVRVARAFHISPLYAFTLPLGALIFTAMMFASAFKVLSGKGVTWKGRTYT